MPLRIHVHGSQARPHRFCDSRTIYTLCTIHAYNSRFRSPNSHAWFDDNFQNYHGRDFDKCFSEKFEFHAFGLYPLVVFLVLIILYRIPQGYPRKGDYTLRVSFRKGIYRCNCYHTFCYIKCEIYSLKV